MTERAAYAGSAAELGAVGRTEEPEPRSSGAERLGESRRERDLGELLARVQVVLARLVDDANHADLRGDGVAQRGVDLANLEGRSVAVVRHAYDEAAARITGGTS